MQKIKFYLISLGVLLVLSMICLAWVMKAFSPDQLGILLLFYFLIAVTGFAASTIFGFYLRKLFGQREFLNSYISTASRQGIWLCLILVVSLILLHQGWFTWLNALFLILTFVFFESYLLTKNNTDR